MKKIIALLIPFIFIWCNISSQNISPNINWKPIIIGKPKPVEPKPKTPSVQDIEAGYQDGNVYIYFSTSEGMADVTVTNLSTGDTTIDRFDTSTLGIVYIGSDTGYYTIEIDTDSGNTYFGDFTL